VVGFQHGPQGLRAKQWGVSAEDQHRLAWHRLDLGQSGAHRVGGAALLGLDDRRRLGRQLGEVRRDLGTTVADHHPAAAHVGAVHSGERVREHRAAGEAVQDLRGLRLHPGSLAGRQDDGNGGDLLGHGQRTSRGNSAACHPEPNPRVGRRRPGR
jgi:hypothetical protein